MNCSHEYLYFMGFLANNDSREMKNPQYIIIYYIVLVLLPLNATNLQQKLGLWLLITSYRSKFC